MKSQKISKQVHSYTAFFDRNSNGSYTVTVPSLPGLVTEGRNIEEARTMAGDAIKCYVEGLAKDREEIPEETEMAQMRITVTV
jgi:predicted RNase H-like HicB family nuclease